MRPDLEETPVVDAARSLTEWAEGMRGWVPVVLDSRAYMFRVFAEFGRASRASGR